MTRPAHAPPCISCLEWLATLSGLFVLLFFVSPHRAEAQTVPAEVELVQPDCPELPFSFADAVELLRVELGTDGVDELRIVRAPSAQPVAATVVLEMSCGSPEVRIAVTDTLTAKHVSRDVALGEVPAGSRARVIAIGIAELIRGSWAELASPSAGRVEPPRRIVERVVERLRTDTAEAGVDAGGEAGVEADARTPPDTPVRDAVWLAVVGDLRSFPAGGLATIGAALTVGIRLAAPLFLRVGVDFGHGTGFHPAGAIVAWTAGGAVGAAATVDVDALQIDAVLDVAIAWTSLTGEASSAATRPAGGEGALVQARGGLDLRVHLQPAFFVFGGFRLGYAIVDVRALVDDTTTGGLIGASLGATVGLGGAL